MKSCLRDTKELPILKTRRMDNGELILMREFAPQLNTNSRLLKGWLIFLLAGFAFGLVGLYMQIIKGHAITGMRDYVVWGVYIVNFIFFMGLSYAGALIAGTLHLMNTGWRKPIMRMAEILTVVSIAIGPLFIILCIGRLDRLYYLFLFGRIQSPITWDVIAISTDLIGCMLYLYLSLIPDLAKLRDFKGFKENSFRKKMYRVLALGYQDTPQHNKIVKRSKNLMAVIIIAIAIIVYSVLAWIFSVTLQPGWHSTIFGPYFVIAAVYSGTGVLIILMWIFRKIYHLEAYLTKDHFVKIGILLLILAAFFGYFTFSEYLTKWYGSESNDSILIDKLFSEFFWMFIISNYAGVILPLIIVGFPKLRSINSITFAAVVSVVALWFNRYLIVVPTLESPYLPIQDSRPEYLFYSPTWVELSTSIGLFAMFCLLFTLASKFVPIIEVSGNIKKGENPDLAIPTSENVIKDENYEYAS
jgi:molybdopterin-containing oxidoreductase family membrane subunit